MSYARVSRGHLRAPAGSDGGPPYLLYMGHPGVGNAANHTWMAANPTVVATSPFDGIIFQIGGSSGVMSGTAIAQASFDGWLDPIASSTYASCVHNMPVLYIQDSTSGDLDFTNDTLWTTITTNWTRLATACQDNPNIVGIVLDNEAYGTWNGSTTPFPWDHRSDLNPPPFNTADGPGIFGSGVAFDTARDQVHARGKQVMDVVRAVWPDVWVMMLHGSYRSYSDTGTALAPTTYNDISFAWELAAAWIAGMVESAALGDATVIDGGELYEIHDEDDAYRFRL
jgi:hypothetical protein